MWKSMHAVSCVGSVYLKRLKLLGRREISHIFRFVRRLFNRNTFGLRIRDLITVTVEFNHLNWLFFIQVLCMSTIFSIIFFLNSSKENLRDAIHFLAAEGCQMIEIHTRMTAVMFDQNNCIAPSVEMNMRYRFGETIGKCPECSASVCWVFIHECLLVNKKLCVLFTWSSGKVGSTHLHTLTTSRQTVFVDEFLLDEYKPEFERLQ